jgi:hypothetical protein
MEIKMSSQIPALAEDVGIRVRHGREWLDARATGNPVEA